MSMEKITQSTSGDFSPNVCGDNNTIIFHDSSSVYQVFDYLVKHLEKKYFFFNDKGDLMCKDNVHLQIKSVEDYDSASAYKNQNRFFPHCFYYPIGMAPGNSHWPHVDKYRIFWKGIKLFDVDLLSVDEGRAFLPITSFKCSDCKENGDYYGDAAWGECREDNERLGDKGMKNGVQCPNKWEVIDWQVDFARFITTMNHPDDLTYFDIYMKMMNAKVVPRKHYPWGE